MSQWTCQLLAYAQVAGSTERSCQEWGDVSHHCWYWRSLCPTCAIWSLWPDGGWGRPSHPAVMHSVAKLDMLMHACWRKRGRKMRFSLKKVAWRAYQTDRLCTCEILQFACLCWHRSWSCDISYRERRPSCKSLLYTALLVLQGVEPGTHQALDQKSVCVCRPQHVGWSHVLTRNLDKRRIEEPLAQLATLLNISLCMLVRVCRPWHVA